MQWVAISGSWREGAEAVEQDVRSEVRATILAGDGIVTGGALGVDYIATDEALKTDPSARQLKIIIPVPLTTYVNHLFKRATEGVITQEQAKSVAEQLTDVRSRNAAALVEMGYAVCNQESYYARNSEVIDAADRLAAFQVNGSKGTQDAIDKALSKKMPVRHKKYSL